MLKKILKILIIFFIGVCGGIFTDQILGPYFITPYLENSNKENPVYITQNITKKEEIYIQENVALKNAIEKVEKTIVGIRTKTKTGNFLEGSGVILTSDGLIITLAELVPSGGEVKVFWEGKTPSFKFLKKDLKNNLALIKIDEKNLPTTGFADLEKLKLGERVFLVGVIFEKGLVSKKTVNEGIVKSFDQNFIETNILEKATLLGSSLFNIEGNLLGLNILDKEGRISVIPIYKIRDFSGF